MILFAVASLALSAPVVNLSLIQPHDAALEKLSHQREQLEKDFVAQLQSTFEEELSKSKPLLVQSLRSIASEHKAFIESPESMVIKVADSTLPKDLVDMVVKNEKYLNSQEQAFLQQSLLEVSRWAEGAADHVAHDMLSSKSFLDSFDVQIQQPKVSYMKMADGVKKLNLLRSQAVAKAQAKIKSMFKARQFIQQPHVSAGSAEAASDLGAQLGDIMQQANSIVSVSGSPASVDSSILDKASDDLKSVTNGALAFQGSKMSNFMQLMPVPMGSEVKNRLFDTEPMQRPAVASLNIFVDEGSKTWKTDTKAAALLSQIKHMDQAFEDALAKL